MIRSLLCAAVLAAPLSSVAAQNSADQRAVLATVQRFFDAIGTRDTAAAHATMAHEGLLLAVRSRGDSSTATRTTHQQFLSSLAAGGPRFLERMWKPTVLIRGPIAQVWTEYDFHRDGVFSHCGVDSFGLVRDAAGWKITGITYTVEPTGCAPSALGPPKPEV